MIIIYIYSCAWIYIYIYIYIYIFYIFMHMIKRGSCSFKDVSTCKCQWNACKLPIDANLKSTNRVIYESRHKEITLNDFNWLTEPHYDTEFICI